MKPSAAERATSARKRLTEVIDAAAKVFARSGYHGSSTQDIADLIGIRQASLYYYFASKEAALEAVIGKAIEDYAARARRIAREPASAGDRVAALVRAHLAPMLERIEYSRVFLGERRYLPEPARQRLRAMERRYERIVQEVIEDGIGSGEFRADIDPRLATLALLGLGNSAAAWFGREPGVTFERIADAYSAMLVRAFRAPGKETA